MEATAPTFFVAAGAELTLTDLPTDALGLVLYQLTLAHDIARVGLTNRALKAAALAALKLRPFSGEVVTPTSRSAGRRRTRAVRPSS